MKKIIISICALFLSFATLSAQGVFCHFGIMGGASFNRYGTKVLQNLSSVKNSASAGWHVGATVEVKLPAYFSIQPAVLYEMQRSNVTLSNGSSSKMTTSNLIIPVAIQWGPDLGIIRPFLETVPYLDITFGGKVAGNWDDSWGAVKNCIKSPQFGLGLGGGLEIWRLQFSVRYNWSFGDWRKGLDEMISPFDRMNDKKQSVAISVAYFFK